MTNGSTSKSRLKKPASASMASPLTPKLEQTLVIGRDLSKQPNSRYILITGTGTSKPIYYAVDSYGVHEGTVQFYRALDMAWPVYVCRVREGAWALVARDAVNFCTEREFLEFNKKDAEEQDAFVKELDPEGYKAAQEEAARGAASPFAMMMPSAGREPADKRPTGVGEDARPAPGQYL